MPIKVYVALQANLRVLQKLSGEKDLDNASHTNDSEFVEHLEVETDSKIDGYVLEFPQASSLHHIYPKYDDSTDVGDDARDSGNDNFFYKNYLQKERD